MKLSLADIDVKRLSPRAQKTLRELMPLLVEGHKPAEIAEQLGTTARVVEERRAELEWELEAQMKGAQVRTETDEEHQALLESIHRFGQLVPAVVDAAGNVVAGRRRERVCAELEIELWTVPLQEGVDPHDAELIENLVRRHLTPSDRRRMIEAELVRAPERSDRAIAATLGVSPTTVGTVRRELEQRGLVSNLDTRVGKNGKTQAARKPERQADEEPDPENRLDYIEQELRSLAALTDREVAHARADELVAEALRELGAVKVAEAYEQIGKWYA